MNDQEEKKSKQKINSEKGDISSVSVDIKDNKANMNCLLLWKIRRH